VRVDQAGQERVAGGVDGFVGLKLSREFTGRADGDNIFAFNGNSAIGDVTHPFALHGEEVGMGEESGGMVGHGWLRS